MPERSVELLSVVVPVRNNEALARSFWERTRALMTGVPFELILVDDGSHEDSRQALRKLSGTDSRVKVVTLAGRFGRHVALQAGLDHASGNVVAIIADGPRERPERILDLVSRWRAGADVTHARGISVADRAALPALPSPAERRMTVARKLAFASAGLAALAAVAIVILRAASSDFRGSGLVEATVLALGAIQLSIIGIVAGQLGSRPGGAAYRVSERRNIAPPEEPLSELEELVSELDLER